MHKGRIDSHGKSVTIDGLVGHDELLKIDGHAAIIIPDTHPLFPVLEQYHKMLGAYGGYFAYEFDTLLARHYKTHKQDVDRL